MGSNAINDEKPPHSVSVKSFALSKTEVTQGQWKAVMGSNPSRFIDCGVNCPVEQVSWNDAQEYIKKLNAKTGKQYRLPSEAEWEYAARGGTDTRWSYGDNESELSSYGWFIANSGGKTHGVVEKRANPYGLSDMHGNVWEWVEDCWHDDYNGAPSNGSAWTTNCSGSTRRIARGGSWNNHPGILRAANRGSYTPDFLGTGVGFRVARTF